MVQLHLLLFSLLRTRQKIQEVRGAGAIIKLLHQLTSIAALPIISLGSGDGHSPYGDTRWRAAQPSIRRKKFMPQYESWGMPTEEWGPLKPKNCEGTIYNKTKSPLNGIKAKDGQVPLKACNHASRTVAIVTFVGDFLCKYHHKPCGCVQGMSCRYSHAALTIKTKEILDRLEDPDRKETCIQGKGTFRSVGPS